MCTRNFEIEYQISLVNNISNSVTHHPHDWLLFIWHSKGFPSKRDMSCALVSKLCQHGDLGQMVLPK